MSNARRHSILWRKLSRGLDRLVGLRSDDQGVAGLVYGLLVVVLLAMAALAVDTAYIHVTRGRLQNAADASALAGAGSLLANHRDLAAVRAEAMGYGHKNLKQEDDPLAALTEPDVTFLRDGAPDNENPNEIEVLVMRSQERDNPLDLLFGPAIDVDFARITAKARAGLVGACSSKCVKPFIVPAKFTWNDYADTDPKVRGNGELDVNSPAELASVETLGYGAEDLGATILLKPGDPSEVIVPSQYNLIDLPPVNKGVPVPGGAMLRENIMGCTGSNAEVAIAPGDELQLEPGNTTGPTKQGIVDLINQDPYAYWDQASGSVQGSAFSDPASSPRVAIIAFYDPRYPPVSGRTTQMVYQVGAVFIEAIDGKGDVTARFMQSLARSPNDTGGSCGDYFLYLPKMLRDSSR